jgi:hypothetical protein
MESTSISSEIIVIDYNDLVAFCDDNVHLSLEEKQDQDDGSNITRIQKKNILIDKIEQAFGPYGLGIVAISNVPNADKQRQRLLPLGSKIPYISNINETLVDPTSYYSVGWSHGKEQLGGQPDYLKGSYYANPLTDNIVTALLNRDGNPKEEYLREQSTLHPEFYAPNIWPDTTLPEFQEAFCQLGQTIVSVGCMVAEVCDAYCMNHFNNRNYNDTIGNTLNLASTIRQSLNCKGRFLHYFAPNHNDDDSTEIDHISSGSTTGDTPRHPQTSENLWCAWHNDHVSTRSLIPQ